MKRDKFKKMRLWLETLKPAKAGDCALLLQGLTMETSETSNFSMESVEQKKRGSVCGKEAGVFFRQWEKG